MRLLAASLLCFAAACRPGGGAASDPRPLVVCTTGIVGDLVGRVAGDAVRLRVLMGPGVDPHLFKPSAGDVRRLAAADLVVYHGLHLEGRMARILALLGRTKPVVALTDGIPRHRLRRPPGGGEAYDPHVWFDVGLWAATVETAVAALSRLVPAAAPAIRARGRAYRRELLALDRWVEAAIRTLPPPRRVLITAHDAFGYFGRRYGLEVRGLQGISTAAEAGAADVEALVGLILRRRLPAIFVESSVPRRFVAAVAAACRARGHRLRIGGELYSDALGEPGTPAATYIGMVKYNVRTLVDALRDG